MTTGELLEEIRTYYLVRFREVVAEHLAAGVNVATEAVYRNASGKPVGDGPFNLPVRTDVFAIVNGRVTESLNVDTSGMLSFEPVSFEWDGASITLRPFQWNCCVLSASGEFSREAAVTPFLEWYSRWFNPDFDGSPDELLGAVHFMSDPELSAHQIELNVDMGSAPVEALEELLDAAVLAGATRVNVGE